MKRLEKITMLTCVILIACVTVSRAESTPDATGKPTDPGGVLRKSIPDRLIVLTFDDAPASHATVVAPILKEMGFGGTFYVCNFDSFNTRKDWYLTFRQMNQMHADGFEIGNHTHGHGGGLENYLRMEDEVIANHGPKMSTVCWPIYQVVWEICPKLAEHGYTFGRGGHERPYRPIVDNPFDVPSFTIRDGMPIENFIKQAQMACQGRVVVFCFHGVPDMEHPGVSLEPATFKAMMQYLKDNNYQCIAMRDMAKYIDPAKAAALPRTANDAKGDPPFASLKDEKPFVAPLAHEIRELSFPRMPPANISKTAIRVTVPYGTDVTALTPSIKLSADATVVPASGASRDFTKPQTYTVTGRDGKTRSYSVTVATAPASAAKEILTFSVPGGLSAALSRSRIAAQVPGAADVTALAPTFTLPPLATAAPASGTPRDFTNPQSYTITAQDGSTQAVTVAIVRGDKSNAFTWSKPAGGNWSDAANWSNDSAGGTAPVATGQPDYILTFNPGGPCKPSNDLPAGFSLNQLVLGDHSGGLVLGGNGLTFAKAPATDIPPAIRAIKCQIVNLNVPIELKDDLTVTTTPDKDPNCFIHFNNPISGPHALTLNSSGDPNVPGINFHDVHFGVMQINSTNTYTGGTFINGGKINVRNTGGLGTGPVTIDQFGTLATERNLTNPVVVKQGTLFHCTLSGPVTFAGTANLIGNCTLTGPVGGDGGLIMRGTNGTYLNMVPGGTLTLQGPCNYRDPTAVFPGTLILKTAAALYNGDPAKWTAANITIHKAATLRLNVGGPGEFTGEQVGTLLKNLTGSVNDNGLMGGSFLFLDTAGAKELVAVSADIADSKGPGGGAFLLKKCGAGALRLSGNNTYTGQTILEKGTLSVSSLNSFAKGMARPSSSLGAPMDIEAGEIVIGEEGKEGDCAIIYTGPGETSDRVINLAGKNSIVTFDQSGSGTLKLTSDFLISGYGTSKTIALKGDSNGAGELAGNITDPYDRAGKATTSLTKSGVGVWTLSGINTYTGPTKATQGTLVLANPRCLGDKADVHISEGAMLDLNFDGEMRIAKLHLDGKSQPIGTVSAADAPRFLKGKGVLRIQ